jgi:hypothetical protein
VQVLYIKSGEISIVDASVIKAQRNRPNKGVNGENTQDPEASYNVKMGSDGKNKSTYGFKTHINVAEDGFIKSADFTAGNVIIPVALLIYYVARNPKCMRIVLIRAEQRMNGWPIVKLTIVS